MTTPAPPLPLRATDVNIELGRASSTRMYLNDTEVRRLAERPSGRISYSDLRDKSVEPPVIDFFIATRVSSTPDEATYNLSWGFSGGRGSTATLVPSPAGFDPLTTFELNDVLITAATTWTLTITNSAGMAVAVAVGAPTLDVDVLVVGGGGGGGYDVGGGGGGGAASIGSYNISGAYTVVVGGGGSPQANGGASSLNGPNVSISAGGGRRGGNYRGTNACGIGGNSGSGGNTGGPFTGGSGGLDWKSSSGAGAAGNGQYGRTSPGAAGGIGYLWPINNTYYGGGGGGGVDGLPVGLGGAGGGGNGGYRWSSPRAQAGRDGFGGGGGGDAAITNGGRGGSGTVIISYISPIQRGTGGTVTSTGTGATTRWFHTYADAGTFQFNV